MPSKVWCDKAPYVVLFAPSEVEFLVKEARETGEPFVWLDLLDADSRVMLYHKRISAVESYDPEVFGQLKS